MNDNPMVHAKKWVTKAVVKYGTTISMVHAKKWVTKAVVKHGTNVPTVHAKKWISGVVVKHGTTILTVHAIAKNWVNRFTTSYGKISPNTPVSMYQVILESLH